MPLFRAGAAEADYEAGREPNVILVCAEKGCAVVVGVEDAHSGVRVRIKVHAPASLHRETQIRILQAAGAAQCVIDVRAADKNFGERAGAPLVTFAMEYARAVMVAIQSDIHAVVRRDVVAGVSDNLQPRFGVPSE